MIGRAPGLVARRQRGPRAGAPSTDGQRPGTLGPGATATPVSRPISPGDVRRIASKGYPLWESVPTMQLRNRRITVAYADLSERLAALIAGDGQQDANWCTYSSWSSKSVGTWIEEDAVPEPLRQLRGVPAVVRRGLIRTARWMLQRGNGASYRCLAAGNRFVFLEAGYAIALFLEEFDDARQDGPDEQRWGRYWDAVMAALAELSQLDPSWMLTDAPQPGDLRLGLRQYYEALFATDPDQRAELVLAGNLLIVAYEQRRVDGYVSASLALFTDRALRNLVRNRSGAMKGWLLGLPSRAYARLMTRGLVLETADEQLRVGRPLPPPPTPPGCPLFPRDLDQVGLPILQALLTRYDRSNGKPHRRRARDWTSFEDRMNYITNVFRSRQQCETLFAPPFPPEVEGALLAGHLAPGGAAPG